MTKSKKKKFIITVICITILICVISIRYIWYINSHTFILSANSNVKNEQIHAINGKVEVFGTVDTFVVFIYIENGKTYTIGYITQGMSETINLEKGKWYTVQGLGELTIKAVNVRISEFDEGKENSEEQHFIAKVIEVYDGYIIVEPDENEEERKSSDKFHINNKNNVKYKKGQILTITYVGRIKESYPAQIGVTNI